MTDFITSIKDRLEKSPWVILLCVLFGYATWLGWKFFLEDYQANIEFYKTIPTLKASGVDLIAYMARFIQIAPILFGYVFLRNTNKMLYGLGSMFFLAVDWGIGAYYRSAGFTLSVGWNTYAVAEDFIFFTVGSEVLLALCGSITISLVVPAVKQTWSMVLNALSEHGEAGKLTKSHYSGSGERDKGPVPPSGRPPFPSSGSPPTPFRGPIPPPRSQHDQKKR